MFPSLPRYSTFADIAYKVCQCKDNTEIGTAIGYSAVHVCLCAGEGCAITTIERNEESAGIASDFIKKAGMEDRIKIVTGDAEVILNDIPGSFDMIFVDAAKRRIWIL